MPARHKDGRNVESAVLLHLRPVRVALEPDAAATEAEEVRGSKVRPQAGQAGGDEYLRLHKSPLNPVYGFLPKVDGVNHPGEPVRLHPLVVDVAEQLCAGAYEGSLLGCQAKVCLLVYPGRGPLHLSLLSHILLGVTPGYHPLVHT